MVFGPGLVRLHVVSESMIALSCLLASLALLRVVHLRWGFRFNGVLFCLAVCVAATGATLAMQVVNIWHPLYRLSIAIEAGTAAMSVITLMLIIRLTPKVFAIPDELADYRFRELIEDAPDAIIQVDASGTIVIVNRTAERMFGYSRQELIGSNVDLLVPQANRHLHPAQREEFLQAGTPRLHAHEGEIDRRARRRDGTEFSVEIGLSPVKSDLGTYITAVIRDVTDRRRLEQELERERDLRGQRNEVLARLAADLAHEIKNPLAIIHARASDLTDLAAQGVPLPADEVLKTCGSIVKTTARAIRVIRGVESLAHEGSHDPMQKADVRAMIDQAVELLQTRYETHGISLEAEVPEGLPLVECREVQIEQVLVNLLTNAFDAIDGDPRSQPWVRVRVSMLQAGSVDTVLIDVVDGGPGVTLQDRKHLMETFYTTKPKGSGMGIGLSVSRTIAKDHGGSLDLLDTQGPTCFRLTLPVTATRKEIRHED